MISTITCYLLATEHTQLAILSVRKSRVSAGIMAGHENVRVHVLIQLPIDNMLL